VWVAAAVSPSITGFSQRSSYRIIQEERAHCDNIVTFILIFTKFRLRNFSANQSELGIDMFWLSVALLIGLHSQGQAAPLTTKTSFTVDLMYTIQEGLLEVRLY